MNRGLKLLIIGHGGHGKDVVADILRRVHGFKSISSSEFAAQKAVFPLVSDLWPDWLACFEDRRAHRALWFHAIAAYNLRPGPGLAEQILIDHDIYTGMRSRREFELSRGLFDRVIWVDRSEILPPEPLGSMELTAADADFVLDNNSDIYALADRVAWMICQFATE
ncbi:MAG: hypothetical protein COB08_016810 [Rhodobacteraceae bacterium]|nr:hypothetical protein [Paracoccaceae bacterium]